MKRRIIFISIASTLLIFLIVGIILIITYSNKKKIEEGYHTILESKSYIYKEDKKMSFTVYSDTYNTLLTDTKNNQYILKLGSLSYVLENVEVYRYNFDTNTLIKIYADLPYVSTEISSDSAKLNIITAKFQLELKVGTISILNPTEYELLGGYSLYGSYSIVDGLKVLVGINIEFSDKYLKMNDLMLGNYAYGNLNQAIESIDMPNTINITDYVPNYNIYRVERSQDMDLEEHRYFIPINYITIGSIKTSYVTVVLDGKKYYIDDFSFRTNDLDYDEYKDVMKDGEYI